MQAATERVVSLRAKPHGEHRLRETHEPAPEGSTPVNCMSSLENLYVAHHDLIFRTAFRITGNAMDAEDILHTVFLRLLRKAPDETNVLARSKTFRELEVTRAYLHRAAVNASLDVLRKRNRTVDLDTLVPVLEDHQPGQEERHRSGELDDWLREALGQMNPRAAEIFLLRFVEGYSNTEIARMLGTSRSVVAVILFRIRGRLKRQIQLFLGGTS